MLKQILVVCVAYALADQSTLNQHSAHQATVTTPQGDITGSILTSRLGKTIYSFRGIRYAKAPEGSLRFATPVPIEKWTDVYNATQDGPMCPQPTDHPTSEDCLLLNVYTNKLPKGNETPKRPVIVFFHPGGWYRGSASSEEYGPQYLLDRDVVLVVPNYRLGTLGFLSTGAKGAPGNNGLKDQVLALKWVKSNIKSFGGDPNSVTIAGAGAGGASVSLHLVSPMSTGLFHKAIIMSGSIFGNWPIPSNQMNLAQKQAKLVNCPRTDSAQDILACLESRKAEGFADSLEGFREFGSDPKIIWTPVVEKDFGQPMFLSEHPLESLQKKQFNEKIPILIGVTNDEYAHLAFNVIGNETLMETMDKNFETIAPISFIYERKSDNSKSISRELRKFYFEDKKIGNDSLAHLGQLYADALVGFGVNRAAKLLASKGAKDIFYYKFDYKGRYSHFYLPDSNETTPYGVVHRDELIYLFQMKKFEEFKPNDQDVPTLEKMTLMWSNFAKTGNPTPDVDEKLDGVKWERYTSETEKYLTIGNKLVIEENMFENRYDKWEQLFPVDNVVKSIEG